MRFELADTSTPEGVEKTKRGFCRPAGAVKFKLDLPVPLHPNGQDQLLFRQAAGAHYFEVLRCADFSVCFTHSSPGTGARAATASLQALAGTSVLWVGLHWAPAGIRLHLWDGKPNGQGATAMGEPLKEQIIVGENGEVMRLGGAGMEVGGFKLILGDQQVAESSAIEGWQFMTKGASILMDGISPGNFMHLVICANFTIAMLVTGFEQYCKQRFIEINREGVPADLVSLARKFAWKEMDEFAKGPLRKFIDERRIDFQDFDQCKRAFRRAYRLSIGTDVQVAAKVISEVRKIIGYRHRIVHVSPLETMLNAPGAEMVLVDKKLAPDCIALMSEFVAALHAATLKLPKPPEEVAGQT